MALFLLLARGSKAEHALPIATMANVITSAVILSPQLLIRDHYSHKTSNISMTSDIHTYYSMA